MNGFVAAKIVEQMCLNAGHATSSGPKPAPAVCGHCHKVAVWLREAERDERPPLSTASVHLVVSPANGLYAALLDETIAIEQARAVKGVVASLPVSSDCREAVDPSAAQTKPDRRPR